MAALTGLGKTYLLLPNLASHFFTHDLPSMLTNNPRKFWRTINPCNHPDITLSNATGDAIPEDECAQVLNNFFLSVFTREDVTTSPTVIPFSVNSMP